MVTYVVWIGWDSVTMELILQKRLDYISHQILSETPTDPEPIEIAENDVILLGGPIGNPFTRKYFFDTGILQIDGVIIGPGAYADGQRCISSVIRPNGTTVTTILGMGSLDTFYAAEDFLGLDIMKYLIPIATGVGGLAVGYFIPR